MIDKINKWFLKKKLENTKAASKKRLETLKEEAAEIKETNALEQAIREAADVKSMLEPEEVQIITKAREDAKKKREDTVKWFADGIVKMADGVVKAADVVAPPPKKKKKKRKGSGKK